MSSVGLSFKDIRKQTVRMKAIGGEFLAGHTGVLNNVATADEVIVTTTAADPAIARGGIFMAIETIAQNAYGRFQRIGFTTLLRVNGTTDIAIGDRLTTTTAGGILVKAASGEPCAAIALEAYTGNDNLGVIDALLTEPSQEK